MEAAMPGSEFPMIFYWTLWLYIVISVAMLISRETETEIDAIAWGFFWPLCLLV